MRARWGRQGRPERRVLLVRLVRRGQRACKEPLAQRELQVIRECRVRQGLVVQLDLQDQPDPVSPARQARQVRRSLARLAQLVFLGMWVRLVRLAQASPARPARPARKERLE